MPTAYDIMMMKSIGHGLADVSIKFSSHGPGPGSGFCQYGVRC